MAAALAGLDCILQEMQGIKEQEQEVGGKVQGVLEQEVDRLTDKLKSAMEAGGAGWLEEKEKCGGCGGGLEDSVVELEGVRYHTSCLACHQCGEALTGHFWTVQGKRSAK